MTGLLYKIFGYSFDALQAYDKTTTDFNDWAAAKNDFNYNINSLVFSALAKKHKKGEFDKNPAGQQFYIDTVTGILKRHYNRRLKLYNSVKQKHLFALLCVLIESGETIARIVFSLKKFRYTHLLQNEIPVATTDVCISFPRHAFSYETENDPGHPRSFAEFLMGIEYAEIGRQNLLSVDEYERASKTYENNEASDFVLPLTYAHDKIILGQNKRSIGNALAAARNTYRSFKKFARRGNLFLLNEYFNQSHVSEKYISIFKELEKRKIEVRRIYVLSFFDIGLLKYGYDYDQRIRVFSYSQNLFIPPAKHVSENLLKGTMNVPVKQALEECELLMYSYYTHHPVGFAEHCFALNHFKSLINLKFGLSLPVTSKRYQSLAVNVGYESLMDVEVSEGIKNILVFDVPIETKKRDIGRTIIGDKTAKEDFMQAFYNDIVSLALQYNCRILLKPKYSLSSPDFPPSYKAMIKSVQEKTGDRLVVLNPYAAIKTPGGKIDLSISFPFTSTYYSIADICKQSVFYVPNPYTTAFAQGVEGKLVLGKENLENIIKYL